MDTIGKRVSFIRKSEKLTMEEFARRIGISGGAVSLIESGKTETPANQTIIHICREFGVNEVWLRTGTGEPFPERTRKDVIDAYVGQLSDGKRSDIEQMLIEVMAETSADEWLAIASVFKKVAEKMNKPDA